MSAALSELDEINVWLAEMLAYRDKLVAANDGVSGLLFLLGLPRRRPRFRFTFTAARVSRMLGTNDKRAAGPLLAALSLPIGPVRREVVQTVTRLLSSFGKTDDLRLLGPSRWRLYQALEDENPNQEPELLVAVLHALETCGTDEDMWALRTWAMSRYNTNAEQAISVATARCRDAIVGRRGIVRDRERLLRSTADQKDPAELLRPTRENPTQTPEMLLRTADLGATVTDIYEDQSLPREPLEL